MEQRTDAELVALARTSKREAFGSLLERYQPMVGRIIMSMIANQEIARELAQEAMLQAFLSLDNLRDATRFKNWLYGITLNTCRRHLQDQKTNVLSLEAIIGGIHHPEQLFPLDDIIDPQRVAEEHELHQVVYQAIQCLSPKDREATLLFYYEQLTLQEIAALLAVSVVAIKGRLHRARKQLRVHLSTLYTDINSSQNSQQQKRSKHMQQVTIEAVRSHPDTDQHIVVLKDATERHVVIWIGKAEAMTIAEGLHGLSPQRPMTAHLMANVFKATGIQLAEARIETLKDEIFYAILRLRHNGKDYEIDARPSDALSLAVLLNCPIYVAEEVIERCSNTATERWTLPLTEYSEIGSEAVLQAREERTAELQKLIASFGQIEAHKGKEEREQAKQQMIAEWKKERQQQ